MRRHQEEVDRLCRAVTGGAAGLTDILAAVTPGGGKSALPVIAAARLLGAVPPGRSEPVVERVCWVVPRDTLRRQAEEAFVDPAWRAFLGHAHSVRAAENAPDPCRGLSGYVTTYQAVAAAPELHLAEFRRHRYLLCVDELHHLPGPVRPRPRGVRGRGHGLVARPPAAARDRRAAAADDRHARARRQAADPVARLPPRPLEPAPRGSTSKAPGWAVVGYDRRAALAERAIVPVRFGALDGEAEWLAAGERLGAASFRDAGERLRPMLFTALRTGYADGLLRRAFLDCRQRRAARREALGLRSRRPGPAASASCWSWRPTRRPRGGTPPRSAAGSAVRRRAWRSRSRTSGTRSSASPASGCCPSRRCWSRSGWPTRAWTRRRSRTSPA